MITPAESGVECTESISSVVDEGLAIGIGVAMIPMRIS